MRRALLLLLATFLAGCAGGASPPGTPAANAPVSAPGFPVAAPPAAEVAAPALTPARFADLSGWAAADLAAARAAFAASCPVALKRADASGRTRPGDFAAACAAAAAPGDARAFFEAHFTPALAGDGRALHTGYFEPELAGARTRDATNRHPLYAVPPDLVEADLGAFAETFKGRTLRGRVEKGRLVRYHDRAAIEAGALAGRGLELAWVADAAELFFLHIQGSGRVRLADGTVLRLGYAGQNGHDYTAIGRVLRARGELAAGKAGMEDILRWMRAAPDGGRALMNENASYIFFRALTGPGPLGAAGIALTPEASAAVDPAHIPLGLPIWAETTTAEGPRALALVAQDTGGAIKGANRIDIFFGAGARARALAGTQAATGRVWLLLPRPAAERLARP